jgi:membrane protein YqaA with SNARE-associated domain
MPPLSQKYQQFWDWFSERAYGVHARAWLFVIAFTESSVSLIPPDILLSAMVLARRDRWLSLAVFTAASSVLGGVAGYIIGAFFYDSFGEKLIAFYGLEEDIALWASVFREQTFILLFIGAFTPLPYKVFTLLSGFFNVNIVILLVASLCGRLLRYGGMAFLLARYGENITKTVIRFANLITAGVVVLGAVILLWYFVA